MNEGPRKHNIKGLGGTAQGRRDKRRCISRRCEILKYNKRDSDGITNANLLLFDFPAPDQGFPWHYGRSSPGRCSLCCAPGCVLIHINAAFISPSSAGLTRPAPSQCSSRMRRADRIGLRTPWCDEPRQSRSAAVYLSADRQGPLFYACHKTTKRG